MYEKIAWNNFLKTGNIESFLEYRKLTELNTIDNNVNSMETLDSLENTEQNVGDFSSEFDKGQGNSNKRGTL